MNFTTFLAVWGAGLSSILGMVQLWSLYRDRFRISSSVNFDGRGHNRTVVSIYNHYKNPIVITGLDLFWATEPDNDESAYYPESGLEGGCNLTIPAHGVKPLVFEEQYYIECKQGKGNLYLRVQVAGRSQQITQQLFPTKS